MKENGTVIPEPVEHCPAVAQALNKFNQGIKDESKFQRKNALETIKKQITDSFKNSPTSLGFSPDIIKTLFKTIITVWNDSIEKCRELSLEIVENILDSTASSYWDHEMSNLLIMGFYQRLGGKEVKEPSEEIRLQLCSLACKLVELKYSERNVFEIHFQEFVSILINCFNDSFAEVKKKSCTLAKLLSKNLAGSNFHMQSETLVKPLLANLTHQHSRVRKDIIDCLCDVVMHGNNKSVTEVVPHLAQRLFDQASAVRMSVIKLAGTWLLDLPDRYSFHSKLIPLLLTGFIDEAAEIKELTESLWWDVGIKYEKENDEELKDKANFLEHDLSNYPSELLEKRGNLGCRELIRLNASKIFPGILNDISDWVEATRVKSIQLLYIMIWQTESNITQHLETVLQTLFKSSLETNDEIQKQVFGCSKLLGHFTDPNVTLRLAFKTIEKMYPPNPGSILILNGLLNGFNPTRIPFSLILDSLKLLNEICLTLDTRLHEKISTCTEALLPIAKYDPIKIGDDKNQFEYIIFKVVFTVLALTTDSNVKNYLTTKVISLLEYESVRSRQIGSFINELKANCDSWNDNSLEPIIFSKLISENGLKQEIIDQVMHVLKTSLNPSRDVQLRTRFLLLIPEMFSSSESSVFLDNCFEDIINEMIIPNIVWKAGRAASAVRMSSIASLLLIIQSDTLKQVHVQQSTLNELLKMMLSSLDDDNRQTRLYVCKIFYIILNSYGKIFDKDQLHKLYVEFIKRLDDQMEEIRKEILNVFFVYVDCLNKDYDKVLYQAHAQTIYQNLLLYLDDPNMEIQTKVFDLLKHASVLNPELLVEEIDKVKDKHRNTKYCDDLIKHCNGQSTKN